MDVEDFDMGYHLRRVAVPSGANGRWLFDYAAAMGEAAFDRDRPLWEFVVVEGLPDGQAALVQKVHHALTDGIGGVQLMLGLLDRTSDGRDPSTRERSEGSPRPPLAAHPLKTSAPPRWGGLEWARSAITSPVTATVTTLRTASSLARLLSPGGSRLSPVLRGHSIGWHFDALEVPVADLHRAGEAAQGTINDAFVAAVAGGLHRYHLAFGVNVERLRLTLPISLRRSKDVAGSNRFTPVRFPLPISEEDPVARIRQIGKLCRRWRQEPALPMTDAIAGALNLLHPVVTTAVMASLLKGVDVVATNVPGVPFRCYLAGAEVLREYGFAPLTGAALNVALLSHAGTACIGVNTDRVAIPDPGLLMTCMQEGFGEICELAKTSRRRAS